MCKLELGERQQQSQVALAAEESAAEKSRVSAGLAELSDHPSVSENNLISSYYVWEWGY